MNFFKKNFWIFLVLIAIALDQISKYIVAHLLPFEDTFTVIPGFFSLTHTRNPGAAFGILAGQRWIFMVFTSLIILAAIFALLSGKIKNIWGIVALSMVLGGGIGNMIDRIFIGEVIDFFAFNFWGYEFAVFNVADIFVCCGVFILAFYIIFTHDFDSPESVEEQNGTV